MSEPSQGRATQAEQEIIIAQRQLCNDVNLQANVTGPPPPLDAVNAIATLNALGSPFVGGAGYKIDPEALATHIGTFEIILKQSEELGASLWRAAQHVTPPSFDTPAVDQARAAAISIDTAAEENRAIATYAQGLIDALRKAHGTYVQQEGDTSEAFKSARDGSNPLFRK